MLQAEAVTVVVEVGVALSREVRGNSPPAPFPAIAARASCICCARTQVHLWLMRKPPPIRASPLGLVRVAPSFPAAARVAVVLRSFTHLPACSLILHSQRATAPIAAASPHWTCLPIFTRSAFHRCLCSSQLTSRAPPNPDSSRAFARRSLLRLPPSRLLHIILPSGSVAHSRSLSSHSLRLPLDSSAPSTRPSLHRPRACACRSLCALPRTGRDSEATHPVRPGITALSYATFPPITQIRCRAATTTTTDQRLIHHHQRHGHAFCAPPSAISPRRPLSVGRLACRVTERFHPPKAPSIHSSLSFL